MSTNLSRHMPRHLILTAAACAALGVARGADSELRTHFNLAARMVWGIEANFSPTPTASLINAVGPGVPGVPPFAGPFPGPASVGGLDREYANGFVRRDNSGNAGGLTTNWGYDRASQIQSGHVAYEGTTALSPRGESGASDDPAPGFEATLQRDFFHGEHVALGIMGAFNWTDVSVGSSAALGGTGSFVTDFYPLGGITPPAAPFTGSASGPNALIGDAPIRVLHGGDIAVTGSRSIEGDLYGFKLGLYAEFQLCKAASIVVSAGPTVVLADAEFRYAETLAYNGFTANLTGAGSHDDWLLGGFVDATLNWYVTDRFTLFLGGGWQTADALDLSAGGRAAELDLGTTFQLLGGLGWRF